MAKSLATPDTQGKGKRNSKPYPIVAIGASAGGLEAVTELFQNLRPDTGMAYVYIQHLDPTHKSMLSEILQRKTKMKVLEAKNLMRIQPNHVFVIPPNKDMSIVDGVVTLNPRKAKPSIHMSVDKFFTSLANKQKEGAIGVVLSGNANDGTYGLKSIKLAGGLTFAQDDTARFQSMPRSAIEAGVVDMVLPPKAIAKELERISKHPAIHAIVQKEPDAEEKKEETEDDENLFHIILLLKKVAGIDFTHYKMNTIRRRIIRRMLLYKLETLADYYKFLKTRAAEINILYQDILINVTSFFRDPDAMEYLKKTLIPRIIQSKGDKGQIRIWIPACATGEEAYSIAILFSEVLKDKVEHSRVQIFATDLSDHCIAKARTGFYSENELADVSPERLKQYFEKIDGGYRVSKSIRDLCVFAVHNVFKDPPFSRLDFISCCNLMIYLDVVLQKKVMVIFHYSLNSSGFLMLSKSETIGNYPQLFSQIEKKYKIYSRKKDTSQSAVFDMHYRLRDTGTTPAGNNNGTISKNTPVKSDTEKTIEHILLREFAPSSVVINSNLDIIQFNGPSGLFLEASSGKASLNLLKMARPGLSYELRTAVHKSTRSGERIKKSGIQIDIKGVSHSVSFEVVPLPVNSDDQLYLVVFSEQPAPNPSKANLTKDKLVKQLQEELLAAKEDMRSIVEEQEASVEELQSANEEIISSNEELQSINEELETSKEEVESANEELQTINAELHVRNEQLTESYEYAEAVFETLGESVLVLDKNLRVKDANKSFYEVFQLTQVNTENKTLFDIGKKQWDIPKLRELLNELLDENESFKGFEMEHDFPTVGKKNLLLNARRIRKNGGDHLVILTMQDITSHMQARRIIMQQEERFRTMTNNVPAMIWTSDPHMLCNYVNKTWSTFTGRAVEQELGKGWINDVEKQDVNSVLTTFDAHFRKREPFKIEFRLRRNDGHYRWVIADAEPNFSAEGEFLGYISSCVEIHDKKLAQQETEQMVQLRTKELKAAIEALNHSNAELSQFAYVASHDLQEPLRKIITFSDQLLVKNHEWSPADQDYLAKVIASAQRMRKLINDLLNFSKIDSPGVKMEDVDLNDVFKEVEKDLELLVQEKNAKISRGKLPIVQGISLQLYQLFFNLLSNSLKFSRKDISPQISIAAKKMTQQAIRENSSLNQAITYYEISVKDNGIGFNPQFAENIFTIFHRLNTSHDFPGSGIGLALCRKIVINHKGLIFAESSPKKGSTFHIILPRVQEKI